jgi:tetratricopeptide (TPR) repeat protein
MLKSFKSMRMINKIKYSLILTVFLYSCALYAGGASSGPVADSEQSEALYSPSVSKMFYEIAFKIADSEKASYIENEQAISFLLAAINLDNDSTEVRELLLKCACRFPDQRSLQASAQGSSYFNLVYTLLRQYVDENADIDLASNTASFLLDKAATQVQKQTLLEQMTTFFANKNPVFSSYLTTRLGLQKIQDNAPEEAEKYFRQAYSYDKYNTFAFNRLVELVPQKIEPVEYLEHLKLQLRANPADIQTILTFCQNLEKMQLYDTAADAYEYCVNLFTYLYPTDPLPPDVYIPWSICCYNSRKKQSKCLEIAETIRKTGKFDIRIESLAGRAAGKLGEDKTASQIIRDAEKKALDLKQKNTPGVTEAQLAWFYNFVIPLPDKAMEWSNKAFSIDSNSPSAAALLAYSLTQKKEFNTAKSLINHFGGTQIFDLALAQIQLEEGQKTQALDNLKKAISYDPGSFEAEKAKDILLRNGQQYIPSINPDFVRTNLEKIFGNNLIPSFNRPEKMFSASFNIRNKELSFGSDLDSVISIVNNSSEPLIINDDSMFTGNIRIDAVVSGDMNKRFPNLVSKKIRTSNMIEPGRSLIVNMKLITGELKDMLMTHPQASLKITFILYLDPVQSAGDNIKNKLPSISPVIATVTRSGVEISGQYLKTLVDSISTGNISQKMQSTKLFIGLLKEQNALKGRTSPYRVVFSDGMNTMLKSALIYDSGLLRNKDNDGWILKVYTMAELTSLPLDFELIEAVSDNVNNTNWPVRMMAVYTLAESQGDKFMKVLDGISKNDQNQLVKDIASIEVQKIRSKVLP